MTLLELIRQAVMLAGLLLAAILFTALAYLHRWMQK